MQKQKESKNSYTNIGQNRIESKEIIRDLCNDKRLNPPEDIATVSVYAPKNSSKICEANTSKTERRNNKPTIIVGDFNNPP